MRNSLIIVFGVSVAFVSTGAAASNWVEYSPWVWVDLESAERSGAEVRYRQGTGSRPNTPPDDPEWRTLNCQTRVITGHPDGLAMQASEDSPLLPLLCR